VKILMVDDSVATLDTFVAMFELAGHITYPAINSESAMTQLEQRPEINLVIVDYCMPGENGLEFCRRVRASGRRVPILMLTAVVEEKIEMLRQKCNSLGNAMVLQKPVDPDSLLKLLAGLRDGSPDSVIIKGK
jgi:CheY-like chemotaxis protein